MALKLHRFIVLEEKTPDHNVWDNIEACTDKMTSKLDNVVNVNA